jgi:hypothetical protein
MGISFLYIGRDENTLKDKLLIETRTELGFPEEMNVTASPFGGARGNMSASAFNTSAILSRYPPGWIPAGFNLSSPYVEAPFPPIGIPARSLNLTALIPWLPADILKLSDSAMSMWENILKNVMPGIPKDFKFSKLYSPGGMVTSELEGLISGIRKGMGFKDPMGEDVGAGGDHHFLGRSLRRLRQRV